MRVCSGSRDPFDIEQLLSRPLVDRQVKERFVSGVIAVLDEKRKRYLLSKLVKMGIQKGKAGRAIYSNQGRWRLSHTSVVEKAWNRQWFETKGLQTVSEEKRDHWMPLNIWFKIS